MPRPNGTALADISGLAIAAQGTTDGNASGRTQRSSALNVTPEVQRNLTEGRNALVLSRRKELEGVVDRHDDLVREAFHLEKFVTLLYYDPTLAKEDRSEVFQEYKANHDLVSRWTTAGPARQTRRAHTERLQSLKGSAVAGSSSSTPGPSKMTKNTARASASFDGMTVASSSSAKGRYLGDGMRKRKDSVGSTAVPDIKGKRKENVWKAATASNEHLLSIVVKPKGKGKTKARVSPQSIDNADLSPVDDHLPGQFVQPHTRNHSAIGQSFRDPTFNDDALPFARGLSSPPIGSSYRNKRRQKSRLSLAAPLASDNLPFPEGAPEPSPSRRRSGRAHRSSYSDLPPVSLAASQTSKQDSGQNRRENGYSQPQFGHDRQSVGGKTVPSSTPIAGDKHKLDEDPNAWMPRIKRVKLTLRLPPPSFSHPAHRPPPPKFGKSLSSLFSSYTMIDGVDYDEPTLEALARKEGRLMNKIEDLKKEGRLLLDADLALTLLGIDDHTPRQPFTTLSPGVRKPVDPWASVVEAAIVQSRQIKGGPQVAAQIASKVRSYWDGMATKEDKVRANEEKRLRALARATMKIVTNEWKKIVFHIREQQRLLVEAEEKRLGHQHLDAILNQSGQILEAQHLDMARNDLARSRSRSSSISTNLMSWESVSQEDSGDSELEYQGDLAEEAEGLSGSEGRTEPADEVVDLIMRDRSFDPDLSAGGGSEHESEGHLDYQSQDDDAERGQTSKTVNQRNDDLQLQVDDEFPDHLIHENGRHSIASSVNHSVSELGEDPDEQNSDMNTSFVTPIQDGFLEDETSLILPVAANDACGDADIGPRSISSSTRVPSPSVSSDASPAPESTRSKDDLDPRPSFPVSTNDGLSASWVNDSGNGTLSQDLSPYRDESKASSAPSESNNPLPATSLASESVTIASRSLYTPFQNDLLPSDPVEVAQLSDGHAATKSTIDNESSHPDLRLDGANLVISPIDDGKHVDQAPIPAEEERPEAAHDLEEQLKFPTGEEESENPGGGAQENTKSDEPEWEPPHYLENYAVARVDWEPERKVTPPLLLRGSLRPYQQSGLEWLASLHVNNLNGILADEMGLGKTIQTIALLAHLACDRGIWGPHLIIVPTSVLLNWIMEFKKFLPGFQILSYHGSTKRRKELRQGWNNRHAFNVCVTSYSLASRDAHIFKRKAWYYMILDEAHMIKNFKSQRWNILLMFRSFRRLLLTGTPLQNNLTELWALLQFLMSGTNFANLKEFGEWFSNPLEKAIEQGTVMDEETQRRVTKLHTVLRPYLLRRLKRDVEKELPSKYEHLVLCRLSKRQRFLYDEFMSRADTRDDLQSGVYQKVANILMQLRKVCNHPDLFEVRPIVTSFAMDRSAVADFEIKELLVRRRFILSEDQGTHVNLDVLGLRFVNNTNTSLIAARETRLLDESYSPVLNVEHPGDPPPYDTRTIEGFRRFRSYQKRAIAFARRAHMVYLSHLRCNRLPIYGRETIDLVNRLYIPLVPVPGENYRGQSARFDGKDLLSPSVKSYIQRAEEMAGLVNRFAFATPAVVARDMPRFALAGVPEDTLRTCFDPIFDAVLHRSSVKLQIAFPEASLLQYDCGKLQELARLLRERKSGGHRVLIFTQMTKILDILEAFLNFHGYLYLRLDGATKIEDRQYITERFNADDRVFAFIASSRSGGVGINLTGADTVVFYDSDFNPQMDRQCEDRAHRIGQIRDVHIYRFVSQYTVEEAMLRKANQKRSLDDLVIQKGEFDWRSLLGTDDVNTGLSALEKALGEVEDVEDAHAAKVAANEEAVLEGVDEADFADADGLADGTTDPGATHVLERPEAMNLEVDDAEQDDMEAPEEGELGGNIDDYMLSFVRADLDFFKEWRL